MRNIMLTLRYDGSYFHGWQIQNNAVTVQECFQKALFEVLGECPPIKGCSRTDSGVHANMYCLNFRTEHRIPTQRFIPALNRFLPPSVAVTAAREVPFDFHARYSCIGKQYIYKILNSPVRDPFLNGYAYHYWYDMDIDVLNDAAAHFLGRHDFTSFCTPDQREKGDFHRTISDIGLERDGDLVIFRIQADGFLYNMVRIIVGTLLYVAQGKYTPDDIPVILSSLDREAAGPTAPPQGLYLNRVIYQEPLI